MKRTISRILLTALVVVLSSCPNPAQTDNPTTGENTGNPTDPGGGTGPSPSGSLTIKLPELQMQQEGKGANPAIPAWYDISGSGPDGATFERTGVKANSITVDSLVPGPWDVTVTGVNGSGAVVSSTTAEVTVVDGAVIEATVSFTPVDTIGTLAVSMSWSASQNITSATVYLTAQGGTPAQIAKVSGGLTLGTSLPEAPGYYVLSRVFTHTSGIDVGGADIVQITTGSTTSFVLNASDSGVTITITPEPSNTIPITFSSTKDNYGIGETIAVTATPDALIPEDKSSFAWYLNGVRQAEASSTITFPSKWLSPGYYRLDFVLSAEGALSSNHVKFTVSGG
jgi:hypothetical protein